VLDNRVGALRGGWQEGGRVQVRAFDADDAIRMDFDTKSSMSLASLSEGEEDAAGERGR